MDKVIERVNEALNLIKDAEYVKVEIMPPLQEGRPEFTREYSYSLLTFAFKSLLLNQDIEKSNELIRENCIYYLNNKPAMYDFDNFYWWGDLISRIVEMFSDLLPSETMELIYQMMFEWCKKNSDSKMFDYRKSRTWHVWNSENHHSQLFTTAWHFSKILSGTRFAGWVYDDGKCPEEHMLGWERFISIWACERIKKGMLIEKGNGHYGYETLKGLCNVYDYTRDAALKEILKKFFDLYWTLWAQEQFDGVRGGGKCRMYPGKLSILGDDPIRRIAWYYMGLGKPSLLINNDFTFVTCTYRVNEDIIKLAKSPDERGTYEIVQRFTGLAVDGKFRPPDYHIDSRGGILKYSYCTPGFIIGTLMFEARPFSDWAMISSQNRWQGVIFSGSENSRVFPQVLPEEIQYNGSVRLGYNTHHSLQSKGTLVTQKLDKYSSGAYGMRVWFSEEGKIRIYESDDSNIFAEYENAYIAVRCVNTGYTWEKEPDTQFSGMWIKLHDDLAPVIIEVAEKDEFDGFEDFIDYVTGNHIEYKNGYYEFISIYGDKLRFYDQGKEIHEVNDKKVCLYPEFSYKSPFVNAGFDSDEIKYSFLK